MRAPLTSILDHPSEHARSRCRLQQPRLRRRKTAWLASCPATALGINPDRHEAWHLDAGHRRKLVSPHREQSADNAIAPGHLGNVGALLEALRYDRVFSSAVHRRRRRCPVITSIRR